MQKANAVVANTVNDERWEAVIGRDATADGQFVYAVQSTGVYCRPTCPSRKPGRKMVSFYDRPADAEQVGFRPCLRCSPTGTDATGQEMRIRAACEFMDQHFDEEIRLADIAAKAGLSPFYFHRVFRSVMGITPRQYLASRRIGRFKSSVREGNSVTHAIYESGYGSSSRLYENAATELGMSPASYKKGGKGTKIKFATTSSTLGRVIVAATDKGVCKVAFGDSDDELERDLRNEFTDADLLRSDSSFRALFKALKGCLEGRGGGQDLPLDIGGTAFQRKVWEALRKIPAGETRSYGEVAQAIGQPTAVRAVAAACASNSVAILIPCHRVIQKDGGTAGYRWGVERKETLLENEKKLANSGDK